jgi:hypothetical protein
VVDTTPKINSEKEDIMISVQSAYLCLVNDFFFFFYTGSLISLLINHTPQLGFFRRHKARHLGQLIGGIIGWHVLGINIGDMFNHIKCDK